MRAKGENNILLCMLSSRRLCKLIFAVGNSSMNNKIWTRVISIHFFVFEMNLLAKKLQRYFIRMSYILAGLLKKMHDIILKSILYNSFDQ